MSEPTAEYTVTKQAARVLLEYVRAARIRDLKIAAANAEFTEKHQAAMALAKDHSFPRYCTVNDEGREYVIHFGNSLTAGLPSAEIIPAERFEEGE